MKNELVGNKYGKLKIIKDLGTRGDYYKRWVTVKCDCGKYQNCRLDSLKAGRKKDCGCEKGLNINVGEKIGRLTVLANLGRKGKYNELYCLAECECGTMKKINYHSLKSGHTKSCGCLSKELTSERMKTHGKSNTGVYSSYIHMMNRCYNKNDDSYHYYGGRGIKVCDNWKNDFMEFYNWAIKNGYKKGLTIDRINSDRNYKPSNCQWLTRAENSKKRR